MFFFFFAFNAAISQHLCVCQPDRPGSICTLDKKCQNFKNEDQILLIEKKPSRNAKSFVNIFQILQKNKKKDENQINLVFDVFGSLPSNPIIFDFSETEKIIKNEENLQVSIKIKGREWKQVINITGLDSISSNVWSNYSAYNLSLSISDIAVLFDVDENHSSSTFFDTLKIQKSRLIVPDKKSFTFNTRNLYTDTISSYSDFTGKIITNEMTFLDTKDPVKIKNFQSPIEVKSIEEPKVKREIKADIEEEKKDYSNFQFTFCLSTKDYNDRAFEDSACDMHSVPHDNQHYISVKSTDVFEIIENAPSNNIIRFYLTGSSAIDPCTFILPRFINENHTIYFQIADPDVPTYLTLKGSSDVDDKNVNSSFHTISTVTIDANLLKSFRNVTLRSSPIIFADDKEEATVQNLVTDSNSIAQFTGTLYVNGSIEMKKTTPKRIKGNILMGNGSTIIVPQMSNFPVILLKQSIDVGDLSITLCDEGEHIEMPFKFTKKQLINILLSDNSPNIVGPINLVFRNDITSSDFDRKDEFPKINCTTYVPQQGLNITFGTEQSEQWPRFSIFVFENRFDNDNTESFPLAFVTILDGSEIGSTDAAANSIFLYFYKVNICLLSYSSFAPFLNGVNKKYENCPNIPLPSFVNKTDPKCYQTGVYEVGYITLDIFDILKTVQFDGEKIFLAVTTGGSIKFPYVSNHVVMLTTSQEVEYDLDPAGNASKLTPFTLQPSVETHVKFTNNFVDIIRDHKTSLEKLDFVHKTNNIYLYTSNEESVPRVVLDDPVQGVHFITRYNDNPVEYYVTGNSYENSWVGPNVEVKYSNEITVPQTAFLADSIIFEASSEKTKVNFIYYNKSVSDYTFKNSVISFTNSNNDIKSVDFTAKSVTLDKSTISQNKNSVALNFEVDKLDIKDIASIPASSFSSPIIFHESASIIVEKITKIIFSKGSIKVFNGNTETPVITHIPTSAQVSAQESDTTEGAKLLADETSQSGFYVETPTDDQIDLEVEGSTLPDDFQLKLTGNNPTVFIDKSFNNIKVPETFDIISNDKYNIKTDLRELPNGIGDGAVNSIHSKQKLTNNLAFIIFIIIFAVIFVVAIILCVVGLTCMPQPEQYDISSEGKDNIYDERDISDDQNKINKDDGEMDMTSSGANNEIEEDEKKKKEDEVANQEKQPEGSYSVEIEQADQSTDSAFFDDADESTGKKPK